MDGRFKPSLDVGGRSILMRQIDALRGAAVEHIALIGRWSGDGPPPAMVVADAVGHAGSLGGLYTALLVALGRGTIVLAGDMPFVDARLIGELVHRSERAEVVLPRVGRQWHPLCAWYKRSLASVVKARIDRGELRVRDAIAGIEHVDSFEAADTMLMNINTIADYERACATAHHRP